MKKLTCLLFLCSVAYSQFIADNDYPRMDPYPGVKQIVMTMIEDTMRNFAPYTYRSEYYNATGRMSGSYTMNLNGDTTSWISFGYPDASTEITVYYDRSDVDSLVEHYTPENKLYKEIWIWYDGYDDLTGEYDTTTYFYNSKNQLTRIEEREDEDSYNDYFKYKGELLIRQESFDEEKEKVSYDVYDYDKHGYLLKRTSYYSDKEVSSEMVLGYNDKMQCTQENVIYQYEGKQTNAYYYTYTYYDNGKLKEATMLYSRYGKPSYVRTVKYNEAGIETEMIYTNKQTGGISHWIAEITYY